VLATSNPKNAQAVTGFVLAASQAFQADSLEVFLQQDSCGIPRPDSTPSVVGLVAHASDDVGEPTFFCWALDQTTYGVEATGRGVRLSPGGERTSFQVRVDTGFAIERIYYQRFRDVLYLYYQISDGEDAAGIFDRLDISSLRPEWPVPLRTTFNISPALLSDTAGYLASLDFVAKVDLRRGVFLWRHFCFHLPERRHYYRFHVPRRVGSSIYFPEAPIGPQRRALDTIVVDDRAGRVLAPKLAVDADSMPR
jgi:hypothetical protein